MTTATPASPAAWADRRPLPTSSPSAQGVDARGVLALVDALEAHPAIEPHSLVVLRHGVQVAAGWWAPYAADVPHLLYSLSKSFTSAAAGLAAAEGLLDLGSTVLSHFPELDAEVTDPRSRALRLADVAAMASGHTRDTWAEVAAADPGEPVRAFLRLPPEREPGSVFAYNQPCTYSLAAVVQRVAGEPLTAYLRSRLLDPLGVGAVGWQQHPAGRDLGFTGLHATTGAVARLGQLLLARGAWEGRQLLPAAWVDEATRSHVATWPREDVEDTGPDWKQGYGQQFWRSRHGYRGDGAYGQFCLVLPEQDAVVAITSATEDMQAVLDAVWEHLLPALGGEDGQGGAGAGPEADAALAARLEALALPALDLAAQPGDPAAWDGARLAPAGGRCAAQPSLTAVGVARDGDGDGDGWRLDLVEGGHALPVRLGAGRWALGEPAGADGTPVPVAASGGWGPDGSLRADVQFLQTPHRLHLELRAGEQDGAGATARWGTTPLRTGRLDDLRAPR